MRWLVAETIKGTNVYFRIIPFGCEHLNVFSTNVQQLVKISRVSHTGMAIRSVTRQ